MKQFASIIIALAAVAALAQVTVLETETVEITKERVRNATVLRNDPVTGTFAGAEVEYTLVTRIGTNVLSVVPLPPVKLTPEQVLEALPQFNASQAAWDAALERMRTNAPATNNGAFYLPKPEINGWWNDRSQLLADAQ